jgi:hypothetical protein
MANFTVRVELYGYAKAEDYDDLHEAMRLRGFKRTISSETATFALPGGEYNLLDSQFTRKQVLDSAKAAAATTWSDFGVLVTQSAGRTWDGLRGA